MPNLLVKESAPHLQGRERTLGADFMFETLTREERAKVIDDFLKGSSVRLPRAKYMPSGEIVKIANPPSTSIDDYDREYITRELNMWREGKIGAHISQFLYNTNTHSYEPNPEYFQKLGLLTSELHPDIRVPLPSEVIQKYAKDLYPAVDKAKRTSMPVVFLAGSCDGNEWRERLKKAFSGRLCFIDPYDSKWKPQDNIYPELAGLFIADHVVAYKGGSGTKKEEKFLKTIGKISKWKDFNDVSKITDYLEDIARRRKKTAKEGVTYDYSNTQISLPKDLGQKVYEYGKKSVKDEDLYKDGGDKGRENEMHVTVLYGITSPDPDEVEEALSGVDPFEARLGLVTVFKDDKKYDVLKIDVESPVLQRLHYMLEGRIKNENTHPTYSPHATIAYIQKGTCDSLIGGDQFQGKTFKIDSIVFSSTDGRKIPIKLRGDNPRT